ncbi:phosphotransferase system PTS sorbose-specific IIC subunit [Coriobacterium glomerans PW2]|uniref:Phosphotransferase system PTS sorbose-specific IIC subunit n=1 Tax=Coriobacterium glomerans (strain ATCC 49209 / DSM 20642 / JCM 10262 / PW2) TaxID=700015 RepID=F2N8K1_CORGP|nr:PTS sugar transporter subunit IIC [Coriobacterium glomerans]AEB07384.1 phosphotransferase system PTS sorbose-specific IIC subunit [Coriobacterium glomerans PW2]
MVVQALLLGILSGFAIWDGRVCGQWMFERPIVLGPLVGLILGDVSTGVITGAAVELVMTGVVSIGAAVPPDVVCGGILATAFSILSGLDTQAAVALSLPIATLAQSVGILVRTLNSTFLRMADTAADKGDFAGISRALWGGATLFWISNFLIVFLGVLLGAQVIGSFVDWMPSFIMGGLKAASGMLPALGIAILMQLIFDKTNAAYLFVGFVLTALLGMSTTGVAIVGATIAYVIYQAASARDARLAAAPADRVTGSSDPGAAAVCAPPTSAAPALSRDLDGEL